jgi:gluconokinase
VELSALPQVVDFAASAVDDAAASAAAADPIAAIAAAPGSAAASSAALATFPLKLSPDFVARWPELAAARIFLPLGDGACANLGSDCGLVSRSGGQGGLSVGADSPLPRRVTVTVGTSAAVRVVLPAPPERVPLGLWCYRIDEARVLLGGALTDGGG